MRDVGLGAGVGEEDPRAFGEPGGEGGRVLDGGGEADAAQAGGEGLQAGEGEEELVAALGFGEGVDLVHDDALKRRRRCAGRPRRRAAGRGFRAWSAGCAAGRRAGGRAGLAEVSPVRSSTRMARPSSSSGRGEVAPDVGGQRLERRDVEGVEAGRRARRRARRGVGRKPASVLPPPVGAMSRSAGSPARASIASWCGCGDQPRRANQAAKRGGRRGRGRASGGCSAVARASRGAGRSRRRRPPRRPWRGSRSGSRRPSRARASGGSSCRRSMRRGSGAGRSRPRRRRS